MVIEAHDKEPQNSVWKRIGSDISKARSWKEAIALAKLNWAVEKKQLPSPYGDKLLPMWANFRTDTKQFIGKSGSDYSIIQNDTVFDWVDPLVQVENGAKYVTAGALGGGALIWCLAQIPEAVQIRGTDDRMHTYVLFINYHEAGRSGVVKLLEDREVCSNGLVLPFDMRRFTVPHRSTAPSILERGKATIQGIQGQVRDVNAFMNTLAKTPLDVATVGQIIREVFPTIEESAQAQNRAREVLELFEDNDGNAFPSEAGTAFALMNGFTNFIDHKMSVRTLGDEAEEAARARNALFGAGEALKFTVLTAIVQVTAVNSLASYSDKEIRAIGIRN